MPNSKKRDPYVAERTAPFTLRELEVMCQVTAMTHHLWRKGTPTKPDPLPATHKGREVRLPVKATLNWLRKHEVPIHVHPDDLLKPQRAAKAPAQAKPGPKPRAAAVARVLASERPLAR